MTDVAEIDQNTLTQLKELMGDSFSVVIESYIATAEESLSQIRDALEHNQPDLLQRAAHSLKSSSKQIGALNFADDCNDVEELMRTKPTLEGLHHVCEKLEKDCHEVLGTLKAIN